MLSQVTRPVLSAVTKRSAMIRAVSIRAFTTEEPKYQLEQVHHQVAPLTDSTLYAPQGYTSTEASSTNTSASSPTEPVFTPSVNAVFDE